MKIPSSLSFGLKLTLQLAPYRTIAFLYAVFVILNGFMLIVYERDVPDSNLQSVYNGFWTMAITQATVGYGDFMPTTDMGRILAVLTAGAAIVFNSLVLTISLRKLKLTIKEVQFLVQVRQRKKLPAAEVVTLLQRWVRLRLARKHGVAARFELLLKYISAVDDFKVMRRRVFQKDRRELKQVLQGTSNRVGQQLKESIKRYQRLVRYASVLADISTKQVAITSKLMLLKRRLLLIMELDKSPRVHRIRRKGQHMATNAKRKQASELAFRHMLHHRFGSRCQTEAGRASTTVGDGTPARR
jgi:hypothetical protein